MNLWAAQSKMNDRAIEHSWGKNYVIAIHTENIFLNCHYLPQFIPTISEITLQFYSIPKSYDQIQRKVLSKAEKIF